MSENCIGFINTILYGSFLMSRFFLSFLFHEVISNNLLQFKQDCIYAGFVVFLELSEEDI